jgi:hypothetical protein
MYVLVNEITWHTRIPFVVMNVDKNLINNNNNVNGKYVNFATNLCEHNILTMGKKTKN